MNAVKIGMLTLGLFVGTQVIAQDATAKQTKPEGQKQADPEKMFARMDANSDGSIDKAEFTAAKEKREEKTGKEIDEQKQFAKFDTNSDGLISKQEFIKRRDDMKKHHNANGGKPAPSQKTK